MRVCESHTIDFYHLEGRKHSFFNLHIQFFKQSVDSSSLTCTWYSRDVQASERIQYTDLTINIQYCILTLVGNSYLKPYQDGLKYMNVQLNILQINTEYLPTLSFADSQPSIHCYVKQHVNELRHKKQFLILVTITTKAFIICLNKKTWVNWAYPQSLSIRCPLTKENISAYSFSRQGRLDGTADTWSLQAKQSRRKVFLL